MTSSELSDKKGEKTMTQKGYWLNTKEPTHPELEKPCIKLGYCPYGQLVEEFPFHRRSKLSCSNENGAIIQFGHDCPVHYHAEGLDEIEEAEGKSLLTLRGR
jgi:hypothetical protein